MLNNPQTTFEIASELLGRFVFAISAVRYARLHYRNFEYQFNESLRAASRDYSAPFCLNSESLSDLSWWATNLGAYNNLPFSIPPTDFVLTSEASESGWGATCDGVLTSGVWSEDEKRFHINALELKGATFALMSFGKDWFDKSVLIRVDNTVTLCYINKQGSPRSKLLTNLAKVLLDFAESRNITIRAEHIPGIENTEAGYESRHYTDNSDWKLNSCVFGQIDQFYGSHDLDLFADRNNHQLALYISWRPDPFALSVDALLFNWTNDKAYAFPPFAVIGPFQRHLISLNLSSTLVAPFWPAQTHHPMLPALSADFSRLLPQKLDLLTNLSGHVHQLLENQTLKLAVWKVSAKSSDREAFLSRFATFCWPPGDHGHSNTWSQPGPYGSAGVVNGLKVTILTLF